MILNIAAYHFAPVDDADALAATLRERAAGTQLRGTILVAPEGVNLFLAGAENEVEAFLDALRDDARFPDIVVKRSWSQTQPFARFKVKRKHEIIAFRQDEASPLRGRAPALAPETLARWLGQGRDDDGRRVVLLDTRNRCEIEHGHFANATTLPIDRFTDLPAAMDEMRDSLDGAAIVSYCTGGIRCEKAVLWMQANGFDNVWQLDGGILGYFEQVGGFGYEGACFVFDERIALDAGLRPVSA